jgi:uncharacterized membrane protein YdjX (TVP38/TMEM64 family)
VNVRWSRVSRVVLVAVVWTSLALLWWRYQRSTGLGPLGALQTWIDSSRGAWWAVAAYVAISVARPLVLFPAVPITLAAGILFGPVAGVAAAVIGANLSALMGHTVGSALRGRAADAEATAATGPLAAWTGRLRTNSFETVLVMRLLFLPYDLVNYGAGLLRVRRTPFLAATAIGSFPATVGFVLLGASLTRVDEGFGVLDPRYLVGSVVLIVGSLVLARLVRRWNQR